MSYQVLARKWRPHKFEDVVGQEHIVRSLQNSLAEDRVGHAYIFSGTRGIGKTSVARIFAKALRCLSRLEDGNSCGKCQSCTDFNTSNSMDVVEIDGASNNSVDDIRDLIGNVQYLPTSGKYKVYIIDEVHMLSTSAFNALLKTLEEPPEHAIFILATTEPDKLLGTVLSRCQRFDFRNANVVDLDKHLKKIAETEGITFEKNNLVSELSKLGNGSFRDTLSLLDQVLSFSVDKKITEEVFAKSLGVAKTSAIKALVTSILIGDAQGISDTYRSIIAENVVVKNIVKSVLETFFAIISSKDFGDYTRVSDKIEKEQFDQASRAELYWIYEVLSQDFAWSLDSLIPEDASELVLRKVALRNDLIAEVQGGGHANVGKPQTSPSVESTPVVKAVETTVDQNVSEQVVDQVAEEVPELEVPEHIQEEVPPAYEQEPVVEPKKIKIIIPQKEEVEESNDNESVDNQKEKTEAQEESNQEPKDKTWEGFLAHLGVNSPAASANLEQGNLLETLAYNGDSVSISLGFPQSAKVFFDYLNETQSFDNLKESLADFFDVPTSNISLNLEVVEKEKAEQSNFKSKFEIKVDAEEKEKEKQKIEIETDPIIKHAQDVFGSKIDKILLKDNK